MSDVADGLEARLRAYEGRPAAVAGVGRDPVNLPMIRHWCEAMGDANPAYTGADAIAPPTMLQAWIMGGLGGLGGPGGLGGSGGAGGQGGPSGQGRAGGQDGAGGGRDRRTSRAPEYEELLALLDEAGCTAVVATDCEQEYVRPLRPGDEVAFDTVIESVSGRKTTALGAGYFVTTRTDVRVAGELVGTHRFRILKYAPARRKPKERRPRPVVNRDNAGFWEGVREHRLLIQRCTACDTLRFPWLPGCNACGAQEWDTVEASGEGTVFSYVVMHHPPFPAFAPPYAVGLIELAEGVRIVSDVVGVPYDKVRIGMPVRLEFRRYDEELVLPVFEGAAA